MAVPTKPPTLNKNGKPRKPHGKPIVRRRPGDAPPEPKPRKSRAKIGPDTAKKKRGRGRPRKPAKGGRERAATARVQSFVAAYLTNGHNATAAAVASGSPPRNASSAGYKMLPRPEVQSMLSQSAQRVANKIGLDIHTWAEQLQAVVGSDIGELIGVDGQLIPLSVLPRHVRRAIAGTKMTKYGREYKFWDKVGALQIMARHLGLFEKDNAQQTDIHVRVELVG